MQAKPEEPPKAITFDKLLLLSRVVSEEDIESALQQAATSPAVLSRVLNLCGYLDETTMSSVLQAYTMMTNGFLSQDDTVIALDYCLHKPADSRVTFGQALSELGWNAMVPLQMQSANSVDISQVRLAAMQPGDHKATSAQDFAESTLGALAELESAAKVTNDAAQAESNGQGEDPQFWGVDKAEDAEAPETAESIAAAEELSILNSALEQSVAIEPASAGDDASVLEAAAALESAIELETAKVEAAAAAIEEQIAESLAEPPSAGIDSAALLAAELAAMQGTEEMVNKLRGEEPAENQPPNRCLRIWRAWANRQPMRSSKA